MLQTIEKDNNIISITSRQIAEITNKKHSHIKRDIEVALKEDVSKFGRIYFDSMSRKQTEYLLPKNIALGIVSGYSFDLRMKIINRLEELENQKKTLALPQNYIEALEALTKSEKEKVQLQHNIQEKDKVILAVADLNIKSGEVTIGDFSKNIAIPNLGQNNMYKWLKGRGFLTMDRRPYQPYVERGYFVRRPSAEKINGEYRYTTYLTAKGTVWLAKILRAEFELQD